MMDGVIHQKTENLLKNRAAKIITIAMEIHCVKTRILYGKDVDVMKRKIYRIKLWIDKINFCKWDVYAKDNMEAQSICEHLKECCIKNGGWTPVMAEIKCL